MIDFIKIFKAPASMKSVLGSFWFLTTCIGNILVVFFVEIKLWPTQVLQFDLLLRN